MATITRQSHIGELALSVLHEHFEAMRKREAGTRLGTDPEDLHDMRVATRRLRAALRCFEDVLPEHASDLRRELGWLGRSLGAVRDLDVQLQTVDEFRMAVPSADQAGVDGVRHALEAQREHARGELVAVLDSGRYQELLARIDAFLAAEPAYRTDATVADMAPRLVKRMFRKMQRLGNSLHRDSPPEDLHALRIRAKRVRYMVEFIADLYGRPARRFVRRVVDVQDVIGQQHDADVAVDRLRSLVAGAALGSDVAFVTGEIAQCYLHEGTRMRGRFERAYKRAVGKAWTRLRDALADSSAVGVADAEAADTP